MLNDLGKKRMADYKQVMANAVKIVITAMPDGREKAIFLTKMEEGVFFGAKAIAALPENHDSKTEF